jgi:predicted ATP-dependent endonuclease of OLD family
LSTEQHIYITDIYIKELRHLKEVTIPITTLEKGMKHLILTGKNGSGKTSLLERLASYITDLHKLQQSLMLAMEAGSLLSESKKYDVKPATEYILESSLDWRSNGFFKESGGIKLGFNIDKHLALVKTDTDITNNVKVIGDFTTSFFEAKRVYNPIKPSSIEKIAPPKTSIKYDNSKDILRFLVLLRNQLTDAHYTKNYSEVKKLEAWFIRFEAILKKIFNDSKLSLQYDNTRLNFIIHQTDRNSFDFNSLPDGYASILRIVTELMLRMGNDKTRSAYKAKGIVLIDEIEAHLHIELQKNILPLLTTLFPNIQFIVSTHSPFILNSIENAVVHDLETGMHFEDASEISVSSLIENYFLVKSDYSALMNKKMNDFEALAARPERTDAEDERLADLLSDLKTLSPLLSPEMYLRFTVAQKQLLKPAKANA